jgi:hypothetical protein
LNPGCKRAAKSRSGTGLNCWTNVSFSASDTHRKTPMEM